MPTVTAQGVTPRSLPDYMTDLTESFRSVLGADMSTAPESPQMQIIGALAITLTQLDEEIIASTAGMSLYQSSDIQLDRWGELLGMSRSPATHSTVTLTLSGVPTVIVPAGSRVQSDTGATFATTTDVIILPGGNVDVTATAVEPGAIVVPARTLTTLVDVIAGWTGATNAAAATPGVELETDAEYRRRYTLRSAAHARDSTAAIRARLLSTAGVSKARVHDNPTAAAVTVQGVSIPAHAVLAIVQGGDDRAVAESIAQTKPVGIPTTGGETVSAVQPGGNDISFSRAVPTRALVAATIDIGALFPPDGISQIQRRVADWAVGAWSSGSGDFDTSGLSIGEGILLSRLYSPINSVPGHDVTALTVTDALGGALPTTTPLATVYTIAASDVRVTIA